MSTKPKAKECWLSNVIKMEIFKQINKHNPRLLLVFSGWAASPEIFSSFKAEEGMDIWICYDYRDLTFNEELAEYKEIYLVAWSLGVWAATLVGAQYFTPTVAIAINGTPYPIHDTYGIPRAIFRGTLDNITEEGMHRFNRRMCGNRDILSQYEAIPSRPLKEISDELHTIYQYYTTGESNRLQNTSPDQQVEQPGFWMHALLSSADRIFPAENLRNYWLGRCRTTEIRAPHYPFYLWKEWNEIWKL